MGITMKNLTLGVHPKATRLACTRVMTAMHHPQRGVGANNTETNVTMIAILVLVEAHPRGSKIRTTPQLTMGLVNMAAVAALTVVAVIARPRPTVSTDPPTRLVHLQVQISRNRPTHETTVALVAVLRVAMTMDRGLHNVPATLPSLQSTTRALRVVDTAQEGR